LYAVPVLFPNPSLEILIQNDKNEAVINYTITDYDYFMLTILVLSAGLASAGLELSEGLLGAVRQGFIFSVFILLFFGSFVLIDARLFAHRIKKTLLNRDK
jgi:hypothetical protein